jgi:hypothetical protein
LPASLLKEVSKKDGDLAVVQEILSNFQLVVDSAEQPINRPSQPEKHSTILLRKEKTTYTEIVRLLVFL